MQFATKTIVVTGAGSGIGRELALQLLRKGANVAGVDINPQTLAETQALAGVDSARYQAFALDITNQTLVAQLPAEVFHHFGQVDGLINNAGIIQPFRPVQFLSVDEIELVLNVNFYGTVYLTKAFLPLLLARPAAHIANVSSMGGLLPVPGQVLYGAAKAAVKLFTEGLYAELRNTNVGVTVIFPGAIATNITTNSGLGQPAAKAEGSKPGSKSRLKPLPAAKAAAIILKAIEKNQFRVVVGNDARFLDLFSRFSPQRATHFVQQKMKAMRGA